jgi:hypothetical protein
MKTIIFTMAMGAVLVCGCKQEPDPRVAKLEGRVAETEAGYRDLYERHTNLCAIVRAIDETNRAGLEGLVSLELTQQENWKEIREGLKRLQSSRSNLNTTGVAANYAQSPSRQAAKPPMREGVPLAVYNQIAADAVRKWGGDYEMQDFEIKNQTEAYRKLHP